MTTKLSVALDSNTTKTAPKGKTMTTTKTAKTVAAGRKASKTTTKQTKTEKALQRYKTDLTEEGISDLDIFKSFFHQTLPATYHDGFAHTQRKNGRIVASCDIQIDVDQALEGLRYNSINRVIRWGGVSTLLTVMDYPEDHPESWVDDVSTIIYTVEPSPTPIVVDGWQVFLRPAIADGQHRFIALILKRGTWRDIQKMLWYLHVNEHNRRTTDESEKLSHDFVTGLSSVLDPVVVDDQLIQPTGLPTEEWLDLIENDPGHVDAMELPIKEYTFDWAKQDKSDPFWFGVRLDVSKKVFGRCDQNRIDRDGGDFISQTQDTGNAIVAVGMPQNVAATLTRNIGLRCKGWTPTDELNEECKKTGRKIEKRGGLNDGGRFIGPPSYPTFFRFYQTRILAAWTAFQGVEDYMNYLNEEGDIVRLSVGTHYSHTGHPCQAAYIFATTSPSLDSAPGNGGRIPDNAIQVALGLRDPMIGKLSAYHEELADIALRLRHGVCIENDDFAPDKAFLAIRKLLHDAAKHRQTIKTDPIVTDIVEAWKSLYPDCRKNAAFGRHAGLDTTGVDPDTSLNVLGIRHPGHEAKSAGRPKGSKNKKA